MIKHLKNIKYLYGDASIRIPNNIFKDLSSTIKSKNGKTNIQQVAFAYSYMVAVAFLYKYAHFIDVDNCTYMQNSDIKELLGYNRGTKSIDKIIKRDGVLDSMSFTATTKEYPIRFVKHPDEMLNGIPIREFITISEIDANDINYSRIKDIVKNRNYEVKEPLFLTTSYKDSDYGTLYSIERTHQITIDEFIKFVSDDDLSNIDFFMYGFFKSRCKGLKDNLKSIAVYKIVLELGIDRSTFYNHLELLKKKKYIQVNHKSWKAKGTKYTDMEANDYIWKGVN